MSLASCTRLAAVYQAPSEAIVCSTAIHIQRAHGSYQYTSMYLSYPSDKAITGKACYTRTSIIGQAE